jgi:hypothetical protein
MLRLSIAGVVVLTALIVVGCGSSSKKASCGQTIKTPQSKDAGQYGGTLYIDVEGSPIVSFAGGGTSCAQLQSLAHAYSSLKGVKLFSWLDAHHWTWMNYDEKAMPYAVFDLNTSDVFIGSRPGQRSQVSFAGGSPGTPTTATPATTAPTAPTTERSKPELGFATCGGKLEALAKTTSCDFANNVFYMFYEAEPERAFPVYSPAIGKSYEVTCTGDSVITCTGGVGAKVRFPKSAVEAYTQSEATAYAKTHDLGP